VTLYLSKSHGDILRSALRKVEKQSDLTATGPGSILRSIIESVTSEIGDMFTAMDFNLSQTVVSTAQGRALDLLGALYGVTRRELSQITTINSTIAAFYFYLETPYGSNIVIPAGTRVFTATDDLIGRQFTYETTESVTIPAGQLYAYSGIRPKFTDSVFTAGAGSLSIHDFVSPPNATVFCRNAKPIPPQLGFESDDDYRLRIIKNIRVTASGTAEAVRFTALSFSGVRDARIVQQPYGMGSFQVVLVPENAIAGPTLARRVLPALNAVSPVGTSMFIKLPETLPFDISVNLTLSNDISSETKERIRARARTMIQRYLGNLLPGDPIVYNRMVSLIYGAATQVLDVQITSFAANGTEVLRRNYTPKYDQQIIPAGISVTTTI
jgi:uncharacterized phage protein gp47/JayE